MPRAMFVLMLLFGVSTGPAWSDVYKCPDGKGGSVLRDVPCSVAPPSDSSPPPPRQQEASGLILPIQPTEATCTQLGQGAEAFAILRDRGTPARDVISQFTAAATKTPGVVGEFWESVARSIILQIYANTSWTPAVARQRIELACLAERRAAPSTERGQLTDWEVACKAQGEAAYVIIQARDRGIAYTGLLNIVRDSYRQQPAALAPVMEQWLATVGLALYEQRGLQPETTRQQVEVGCLKALQKK